MLFRAIPPLDQITVSRLSPKTHDDSSLDEDERDELTQMPPPVWLKLRRDEEQSRDRMYRQ